MDKQELLQNLAQFTGTENYYKSMSRNLLYTDGVKFMAESAGAYWLIDAIASHQPKALKNERLRDFQLWELKVMLDKSAFLYCREDTDMLLPVVTQFIPYTDFPLPEIRLYVERADEKTWVCLLPSEH